MGLIAAIVLLGGAATAACAQTVGVQRDTTFYQDVTWSPDGASLLLSRIDIPDDYRGSIAVVNVDGSDYRPLTPGPKDMWATWSPDGSGIAFASTRDGNRDIYEIAIDGDREVRLTDDPAEDTHPDWSTDGARIAFMSDRTGTMQLFVMNRDGSDQRQITDSAGDKWNPRWSPDGRRLVYYGATEAGRDSVYVVGSDGSEPRTLGHGIWPSWNADGTKIVYVDGHDVYEMDDEGRDRTRLLEDAVIARWSPDGTLLAFIRVTWRADSGWPAVSQVFIHDLHTSKTTQVTGTE